MRSWHREPTFEWAVSVLSAMHVVCVVSHVLLASRNLSVGCVCLGLHACGVCGVTSAPVSALSGMHLHGVCGVTCVHAII